MGRPTAYNPEIADRICSRLASGESLRTICQDDDMPADSTVRLWHVNDVEGFSAQYARAREAQAEHWAQEIVDIADTEPDPQKARVRVDARKWTASKILPKQYGERLDLNHSGAIKTIPDDQLDSRLTELLARKAG